MELTNEFTADLPLDRAWALLTDVERIVPCVPGADLEAVDGDGLHGSFKVTVGRTTARYHGVAQVVERDPAQHRLAVRAHGDESQGKGDAKATLTARFTSTGDATKVVVTTDLSVTGRFSRAAIGTLAEAASAVLDEFVRCVRETLLVPGSGAAEVSTGAADPSPAPVAAQPSPNAGGAWPTAVSEPESTEVPPAPDLAPLSSSAPTTDDRQVASRSVALPAAVGLGLLLVVVWVLRRRHS